MERFVGQLLYVSVAIVLALVPGFLFLLCCRWQRRERRNPICRDTLRGPGESLRRTIARLDEQLNTQILLLTFVPVLTVGWILGPILLQCGRPTQASYLQLLVLLAIFLPVPLLRFTRKIRARSDCQLALDTELAVGLELNLIMREGFQVFHDVPAGLGHIAHVVVGVSGVFALADKGQPKPDQSRGLVDAKVLYNGEAIYFPDNAKETVAIAQAKNQAATLASWLSSTVGEPVEVRPVLALPGWYVERKKGDELIFLYGQSHHYARLLKGPEVLAPDLLKRVVQQLDAKCRDVEPKPARGVDKMKNRSPDVDNAGV